MSNRDDVLRQALALPAEDRAFVVTNLERTLSSHDGDASIGFAETADDGISGVALLLELQRRSAAYRAGTTTARPATEAVAEMKARQANYWLGRRN